MKRLIAPILFAPTGARVLAVASLWLLATGPAYAQQYYGVTEIQPGVGGFALNASGQVTGSAGLGGISRAFITAPNGGPVTLLAAPAAGATDVTGFGINDAGRVVGSYSTGTTSGGGFITAPNGGSLTLLPGPARGINAAGQVTGEMLLGNGTGQAYITGPNGTALKTIGTLPGTSDSSGLAVNSSGQVTGVSYDLSSNGGVVKQDAFLYSHGVMTNLGTLPGDVSSTGWAINARGQVVGWSSPATNGGGNNVQAFVSAPHGGALTDIGLGEAYGINDAGDVVGAVCCAVPYTGQYAFIYEKGSLFNLNTLLTGPLAPYVTLYAAEAINDSGDILVEGFDRSRPHFSGISFLLTPCPDPTACRNPTNVPEPTSLSLMALGLVALLACRRRASYSFGVASTASAAFASGASESARRTPGTCRARKPPSASTS